MDTTDNPDAFDLIRDVLPDGESVQTELHRMLEGFEAEMKEESE